MRLLSAAVVAWGAVALQAPRPRRPTGRVVPSAVEDAVLEDAEVQEDVSMGRKRFAELLDDRSRDPYDPYPRVPKLIVTAALLAPMEGALVAPVLGLVPEATVAPPDVVRGLVATSCLAAALSSGSGGRPLRSAVALALSPLRLTIDDDLFPARVAARYGTGGTPFRKAVDIASVAALICTYVVVASVYAHGILQPFLQDSFVHYASVGAMFLMPDDPEGHWWWPFVASSTAFAPVAAAASTAAAAFAAETALLAPWGPSPRAVADVAAADERVDHYYALTSPSPLRATRRAESYRAAVHEWRTTRHEEEAQRLLRAVATSVATAASGTWLASCLAHFVIFGVAASRPGPDPGDT